MQTNRNDNGICLKPEEIVSFRAGELSPEHCKRIEAHCEACAECRKELRGFDEIFNLLNDDSAEATCDVADAVMERIAGENGESGATVIPFGWGLMRAAALLAAALLLGVMVSSIFNRVSTSSMDAGAAVNDAAKWLVSVQDEDGAWDPKTWGGRKELEASLTGLAMLALLRSDIDAVKPLEKAEKHLLSIQNDDGSFGPVCAGSMYNQGIASKALLELKKAGYGSADKAIDRALAYMISRQTPAGGWSYRESDSRSSSVGVSVWQLDALIAGRKAGVNGLEQGLRRGMAWLSGAYSQKGDFKYSSGPESGSMSSTVKAMGAMCMLSAGKDILGMFDSEDIDEALASVFSEGMQDDPYKSYFAATAASSAGGSLADKLQELRDAIVKRRITEGVNAGSWDANVKWGSVGGRIYSTSMAALALSNGRMGEI